MSGLRVLETSLYVDDLAAAERFYHGVLELDVTGRHPGRHVFFRCGDGVLLVFLPEATSGGATMVDGTPIPLHGAEGPGHVAFAVAELELAAWKDRLIQRGVAIEAEVSWPRGGQSVYFRDPAGNSLELASPAIWGLSDNL
jgi:catechol 2,3-dioxygenase-like lactoylglutathione lyase family enzyme